MSALMLAFVAVLLAGMGARDQSLLAALSRRSGGAPGALLVAVLTGALTCGAAAAVALEAGLGGGWLAINQDERLLIAGFALMMAGLESIVVAPRAAPKEPTRSLFAAAVVFLAHQILDAARFLVLAVALVTRQPASAAIGGACGGALALALGWLGQGALLAAERRLGLLRRIAGGVMLGGGLLLVARLVAVARWGYG